MDDLCRQVSWLTARMPFSRLPSNPMWIASGICGEDSPLTVAGAAAGLTRVSHRVPFSPTAHLRSPREPSHPQEDAENTKRQSSNGTHRVSDSSGMLFHHMTPPEAARSGLPFSLRTLALLCMRMSAKRQKQTLNASSPVSGSPASDRWLAASPIVNLIDYKVSP